MLEEAGSSLETVPFDVEPRARVFRRKVCERAELSESAALFRELKSATTRMLGRKAGSFLLLPLAACEQLVCLLQRTPQIPDLLIIKSTGIF